MPVTRCTKENKLGWKWGEQGFCYTYTKGDAQSEARAKKKAASQGAAISMNREIRRKAGRK